jgi:hypothetical protein
VVDFGGVQVAELTQNTKDGLLDPLADRVSLASAANPLATIQDVLQLGGGVGAALQLTKQEVQVNGGGTYSTPSQIFVDIPGALVMFTLAFPRIVMLDAFATAVADGVNGLNAQLGLNVDGTDIPGTSAYGPGATGRNEIYANKAILLSAGAHTIKARIRKPTVQAGNAIVNTNANEFVSLTAVYNSPGAPDTGAIIVREEATAVAGTQPSNQVTYQDVPDTGITFQVDVPATVILIAQGTLFNGGAGTSDYGIAINVDGTDYPLQRWTKPAAAQTGSLFCLLSLDLAAGTHTAIVRAKNFNLAGEATHIKSSADAPTTLLAFWSMPVFGAALLDTTEALNGAGGVATTALGTYQLIAGTLNSFNLTVQQNVVYEGDATALPDGAGKTSIQLGVRIDGIDYPGDIIDTNGLAAFLTGPLHVTKGILLAVGPHTAQLVFKIFNPLNATAANVSLAPGSPAKLTSIKSDIQTLAQNKFALMHAEHPGAVGSGLIPGTLLSFVSGAGVAIVNGSCNFTGVSSVPSNFLYIVVDGNVGSPVLLNGWAAVIGAGGDRLFDSPGAGTLGLDLTAGPHTVQLYVSASGLSAENANISLIFPTP